MDTNPIANLHVVAHIDILSQRATLANHGTLLNMAKMPYLGAFAYRDVIVDITTFVYVIIFHTFQLSTLSTFSSQLSAKLRQYIRNMDHLYGQSIRVNVTLLVHQA